MEADLFGYEAYGSEGGEEEVVRIATPEESLPKAKPKKKKKGKNVVRVNLSACKYDICMPWKPAALPTTA